MYVVIEIDKQHWQEATIRRQLADANKRQQAVLADHWISLETPLTQYYVTRVVGVAWPAGMNGANGTTLAAVLPLEGSEQVKL